MITLGYKVFTVRSIPGFCRQESLTAEQVSNLQERVARLKVFDAPKISRNADSITVSTRAYTHCIAISYSVNLSMYPKLSLIPRLSPSSAGRAWEWGYPNLCDVAISEDIYCTCFALSGSPEGSNDED